MNYHLIETDISDYVRLCDKYSEIIHYNNNCPDPYDGHYSELQRREWLEYCGEK